MEPFDSIFGGFLQITSEIVLAITSLIFAIARNAGRIFVAWIFATIFMKILWPLYLGPSGSRRALDQRRFNREIKRSIERKAIKPEPPAGVDELTWLYRQSTLIAEGAITREGENRAIKEYQAMIKAENKWRSENGLELVEDVTAKPEPKPAKTHSATIKRPRTMVVAAARDNNGFTTKWEEHSVHCGCTSCHQWRQSMGVSPHCAGCGRVLPGWGLCSDCLISYR